MLARSCSAAGNHTLTVSNVKQHGKCHRVLCLQTACILTVDVHCEATSFECVVVQLKSQEGEAVRPCQSFQRLQTHTQTHSAPVIEDIDWAIKCYQGLS